MEEKDLSKLFGVRYNCYRNVGFLYEDLGNNAEALKYLISVSIALTNLERELYSGFCCKGFLKALRSF